MPVSYGLFPLPPPCRPGSSPRFAVALGLILQPRRRAMGMLMSVLGTTAQAVERCTAIEEELHQSQVGACVVSLRCCRGMSRRAAAAHENALGPSLNKLAATDESRRD